MPRLDYRIFYLLISLFILDGLQCRLLGVDTVIVPRFLESVVQGKIFFLCFRVLTFVNFLKNGGGAVISEVLRSEYVISEIFSALDFQHAHDGVCARLEIVLREDLLVRGVNCRLQYNDLTFMNRSLRPFLRAIDRFKVFFNVNKTCRTGRNFWQSNE